MGSTRSMRSPREANASRTDWGPGSAAFRELQAKWKSLPRAGAKESELFARFHAAADKFFTARNLVFAERDKNFATAAAAKRKLIDEIATLFDKIYVSAGLRGQQLILNPEDLRSYTDATFVDLTKR